MGTNFYLRKKKPRLVYDEIHIAKTSWGWKPTFECHEGEIESVKQLKTAYDSGEYTIVDEYDEEYSWEEFDDRVVHWVDRQHDINPDMKPIDHLEYVQETPRGMFDYRNDYYHDEDGHDFMKREFS